MTFISLLLATGAEVPYVMRQVGHADPKVTLSIYAQLMFRGEGERERLRGERLSPPRSPLLEPLLSLSRTTRSRPITSK